MIYHNKKKERIRKPNEFFRKICTANYDTVGFGVDYCIEYDKQEDVIRLIFQESRGVIDWFTNFNFFRTPCKVMLFYNRKATSKLLWVHQGYWKAWKSAEVKILSDVTSLCMEKQCYNIQVIGWSYGGAMANCASIAINQHLYIKPNVVTFGSPRIFATGHSVDVFSRITGDVVQYAHASDIVTRVPLTYSQYNQYLLGEFKFKDLFSPKVYHCMYGSEELYGDCKGI